MSAVRTVALMLLSFLFCQAVTAQLRAGDYEVTNMDGSPVLDGAVAGKTISPDGSGDMVGDPWVEYPGQARQYGTAEITQYTFVDWDVYTWQNRRGTTGVLIKDPDTGGWISMVTSGPNTGRMTRLTLL